MVRSNLLIKCACALILLVSWRSMACGQVSVVALTGAVAPGTGGARFAALSPPAINIDGDVAFTADLSGGSALHGVFKLHQGQLYPIVLQGQSIPGVANATFWTFSEPSINQSGDMAFTASMRSDNLPLRHGVFFSSGPSIQKLVDEDSEVPGLAGSRFDLFNSVTLNDQGVVAFWASLTNIPASSSNGIFAVSNGMLTTLVLGGQLVNGKALGSIFSNFSLNNSGHIVFQSSIEGKSALFLLSGNTFQSIAMSGQVVPGLNVPLDYFAQPSLNDRDEIVFISLQTIISRFIMHVSNAVIRWRDGTLSVVAQIGETIPGADSASLFNSILNTQINNVGTILFTARITANTSNPYKAVLTVEDANLFVRVQENQTVEGVGKLTFLGAPRINDHGLITFESRVGDALAGIFTSQAGTSRLSFPQVADGISEGSSWRTEMHLANRDIVPCHVSVRFYGDDGAPMILVIQGQNSSQFDFTLPPLGTLNLETEGLGALKTGWASVTADQSLSGIAIFSFFDAKGELQDAVGTGASIDLSSMALFATWSGNVDTGIALANPGDTTATMNLTLRDSVGVVRSVTQHALAPKAHMAGYLIELFAPEALPPSFQGRIELLSDSPVVAVGLRQQGSRWTSLPIMQ